METRTKILFANFENPRTSSDRSLCVTLKPPTTKKQASTTRSRELCSRFSATLLEGALWLCFPSILSDKKSTCEGYEGKSPITDHNTSMANTALINEIFVNVGDISNSATQTQNIVMQSTDHIHPLVATNQLQLMVWKVSGEFWQAKVYRELLQQLLQVFENRAQYVITNGPEESGLIGVLNEKLTPLQVL